LLQTDDACVSIKKNTAQRSDIKKILTPATKHTRQNTHNINKK